jgi:hypothetical protein
MCVGCAHSLIVWRKNELIERRDGFSYDYSM